MQMRLIPIYINLKSCLHYAQILNTTWEYILRNKQTRQPNSLRINDTTFISMNKTSIAMGISTAMFIPLVAMAQTAPAKPADDKTQALPEVQIYGKALDPNPNAESGVPYKAKTSGDSRHTRPLAETPQTISVITKAAIDDSGLTELKQILSAQPGITLGTGENGNAFGDRYIIRGQEARSDVFVDGLRDPGMTTRESFAIEQLEISKLAPALPVAAVLAVR
jgi:catecholate siderophore receptor